MGQIGTLVTGAGVVTTISGLSQCDEYILIGDVDTANPLQGIAVEVDGTPFINIQNSAALVGAFAKWQMETAGAGVVGLMFKIATGKIERNTTIRLTNAGATTPAIFSFSDSKNGVPFIATTKSINASSYEDFNKFSALFLSAPANIQSVEVEFRDGHKQTMAPAEVDALFTLKNQAEANGQLNAVTVIDNTDQSIKSVRVYATGAALNVLVAKLPNQAFRAIQRLLND